MDDRIRIFGAGQWGLAIAYHLSNQKKKVQIFDIEKDRIDDLSKLRHCKELDIKFNNYIEFNYAGGINAYVKFLSIGRTFSFLSSFS